MHAQRLMWVAWPAFLVAGVIEMVVFAVVDPSSLQWRGQSLELSRQAVYTLAFFFFWVVSMGASALTLLLEMPSWDVNHPDDRTDEPDGPSGAHHGHC